VIDQHSNVIRIAAIGDLHIRRRIPAGIDVEIDSIAERADLMVIAGDITNNGTLAQAELAAEWLMRSNLPKVAVRGNHDRRCMRPVAFKQILGEAGVQFIDGGTLVFDGDRRLGFAGVSGSGGGFWPDEGPDTLPRRALQRLAVRARWEANRLRKAIDELDTEHKIVITHVAPSVSTLGTEPIFKHFLLGNMEFARAIDDSNVDLVIHGHAHHGNPIGRTMGGTPIRNVAYDIARSFITIEVSFAEPAAIERGA
jgi:Icc-related predicted phosphoesterase